MLTKVVPDDGRAEAVGLREGSLTYCNLDYWDLGASRSGACTGLVGPRIGLAVNAVRSSTSGSKIRADDQNGKLRSFSPLAGIDSVAPFFRAHESRVEERRFPLHESLRGEGLRTARQLSFQTWCSSRQRRHRLRTLETPMEEPSAARRVSDPRNAVERRSRSLRHRRHQPFFRRGSAGSRVHY